MKLKQKRKQEIKIECGDAITFINEKTPNMLHNLHPPTSPLKLRKNIVSLEIDDSIFEIELEPKDILKLIIWWMGQERYTLQEIISLRKKVEKYQKSSLGEPYFSTSSGSKLPQSYDPWAKSKLSILCDENEKLRELVLTWYKNSKGLIESNKGRSGLGEMLKKCENDISICEQLIRESTGKDIEDL